MATKRRVTVEVELEVVDGVADAVTDQELLQSVTDAMQSVYDAHIMRVQIVGEQKSPTRRTVYA